MDFSKILIFFIVSICFVHSSKLLNKLKTQHANSALLKKTAEIELIYFGTDESVRWRFEKMAKWYDYKMHYLGNNTPAMEEKLKNHLCEDHVISTGHRMTNLVSNFKCLFDFFFSRH